jgi:hypothetical protein
MTDVFEQSFLPIEHYFDVNYHQQWMIRNWAHSITLSVLYVIFIFVGAHEIIVFNYEMTSGQKVMRHKKPFELRRTLIVWNSALAVFSILGVWRVAPEFLDALRTHGLVYSMCENRHGQGVSGVWMLLFSYSKVRVVLCRNRQIM